ncbi:MAG: phosphatidate cytidylyltransferase [Candidatus Riflebacteria bacterium]|nr:phosphatidate cytidylyltransferase [Candidatus Riflebacteria bacterium]
MNVSKVLARLPVLIVGIPITYVILVLAEEWVRVAFLAVIALIGQFELCKIIDKDANRKPVPEWIGALVIMICSHLYGERALFISFTLMISAAMIFTVLRGLRGDGRRRFCHITFSLYYLPFCLSCFELFAKSAGGLSLFSILASIWALDIGAYVFGMSLRGPKLAPKISPNKTISGAIGGALSCIVFLYLMKHFDFLIITEVKFWILAISIALVGQLADLFESILKRESEVKDSGALLGSHGGVLDRIDSVLFLGPVCYAILIM